MKITEAKIHEIDRKWVGIENKKTIKKIGKKFKYKGFISPLFGYIYVDKEYGLSLRIVGNIERDGKNKLYINEDFLNELAAAIGKDRIIISVDAINGKIAVKGWTETVDIPLIEGAKQAEKFCSELLFTCVEKEGCMQGTDMNYVKELRSAVSCRVVVAGGVSSVEEIEELEKLHCDVQLGMALYTGKVSLKDAFIR